jgi:MmyB-like transcription regulator ligand binding domain
VSVRRHQVERVFTKRFNHPLVGRVEIIYEALALPGDPDQALFLYTTQQGSPSAEAMQILGNWTKPGNQQDNTLDTADQDS